MLSRILVSLFFVLCLYLDRCHCALSPRLLKPENSQVHLADAETSELCAEVDYLGDIGRENFPHSFDMCAVETRAHLEKNKNYFNFFVSIRQTCSSNFGNIKASLWNIKFVCSLLPEHNFVFFFDSTLFA